MDLTLSQLQTLKTWIVANRNSVFDEGTVSALNAVASPNYYVFKTSVTIEEIMANGFDWTRVDNASVGQARIWEWLTQLGTINPSKTAILKGIGEAWKGNATQAQIDHRRAILAHCSRPAKVWEKLFCEASADWNVGSNGDKTGVRGASTNPDTCGLDANGQFLSGDITLDIVVQSEGA